MQKNTFRDSLISAPPQPRMHFEMTRHRLLRLTLRRLAPLVLGLATTGFPANAQRTGTAFDARTKISLKDTRWHINDTITYPGTAAEGLLMNVRMVNSVFEDTARPDFDPDRNTDRFIARIPDYAAAGVRAFTICLQGGLPGYEGAINSAYEADGTPRVDYLNRAARVIEACDKEGVVVLVSCFYQRQDQFLRDETAVRRAVVATTEWIRARKYTNVMLEIANEFGHPGFDHPALKTATGQAELVRLAKQTAPDLLVSTAGLGRGRLPAEVIAASDFLLIHFNNTPVEDIPSRIADLKHSGKAIVCNEDDKIGMEGVRAMEACVAHGVSWGLMLAKHNQHWPFAYDGPADDPEIYAAFRRLTSAPAAQR